MNSMFYNINTRQVEDFTRRGLEDLLHNRIIRTPLPATDTFQDGVHASSASILGLPTHAAGPRGL